MKKLFFSSMLLGGLMMASCSEDVMEAPEVEKVEKSYAQQFVEKFGTISPEQDWNLAEKKSITINGASRAAGEGVKIYAKYQGVFRLVAHYENIPAGDIEFDAPEFAEEFLVKCNGEVAVVKNGEVANFANSRTYYDSKEGVFNVHTGYAEFTKKHIVSFFQSVSGGNGGVGGGQIADFEMFNNKADGKVTVYPIYWDGDDTNEFHVFGIYYEGENGLEYVPIYESKQDDDLIFDGKLCDNNYIWEATKDKGGKTYKISSRGFDVTLPNKPFGFYVEVYDGKPAPGKNPTYKWHSVASHDAIQDSGDKKSPSHIVYNHPNKTVEQDFPGSRMISIETRPFAEQNGKDKERFDDLFFIVVPTEGNEVITEDPQSYILAVEDMGKDRDYDFNDIVFSVSFISGQKTATITPLAAGGVFPSKLYVDNAQGNQVEINGGKEFHQWFGLTAGANGEYPMVNTFSDRAYVEPVDAAVTIDVPADFSLAVDQPAPMGGFFIEVFRDGAWTKEITGPEKGSAPQMICVPANWNWMMEYKEIQLGYPKFGAWGAGYAQNPSTNWMNEGLVEDNLYNYFQ